MFLLIKNTTLVNVQNDATERGLFELGNWFGFNFLVKFDGLSYVYLGNFGALPANLAIWRLSKLLEVIDERMKSVPIRVKVGLATDQALPLLDFLFKRLEIWLIVNGQKEEDEIKLWCDHKKLPFSLEIFTLNTVMEIVSRLPENKK